MIVAPDCEWAKFYLEHGRVPMIGDARKPWTYPGWLIHYRMLAEDIGITPPRWSYWAATLQAGRLLDDPIPQIVFDGDESERTPGHKHIQKLVDICADSLSNFESIVPLLEWLMFGFGLLPEYPNVFTDDLHEKLYRTVDLRILLERPSDYFGSWIGSHKGRWNPTGFYATPHHLVELITRITFGEGDHRARTVHEPCVGTGRMLLHASNLSLRLSGQDVDRTVLMAAKVNGALYAPWMVRPFPDSFFPAETPGLDGEAPEPVSGAPEQLTLGLVLR